jgi:hypothetical protein
MRRTFGVGVRDVACALKLMRGPAVRGLDLMRRLRADHPGARRRSPARPQPTAT